MNALASEFRRWPLWFAGALLIIAAVSLYDTFLLIQFADHIWYLEQNPVGRWLLKANGYCISLFVGVKLTGTLIVLCTLAVMQARFSRFAFPVSTSIASLQLGLLAYLTVG